MGLDVLSEISLVSCFIFSGSLLGNCGDVDFELSSFVFPDKKRQEYKVKIKHIPGESH